MFLLFIFQILYLFTVCDSANEVLIPDDIVILIKSTDYAYHRRNAEKLKSDIIQQSKQIDQSAVTVLITYEEWAEYAGWTILPLLPSLSKKYGDKKWLFFCDEKTEINLQGLLQALSSFDHGKTLFLGHALQDENLAIIHHYRHYNEDPPFEFPDDESGWAISQALLKKSNERIQTTKLRPGFSIDVKFEIANFFYDDSNGTRLTNVPQFCINKPLDGQNCVSTINYAEPSCGSVDPNDVLIAVKTCEKFHKIRVPIVQKQIGRDAKYIRYYSDVADPSIPTEFIGVNNTERGHCQKLHNIIKKVTEEEWKNIKWLVVIDDDTIMSYERLLKLLACYDPSDMVMLGERYGYAIDTLERYGYEYPTGGGGMVLSRVLAEKFLSEGHKCTQPDAPDDMWLGMVSRRMKVPVIHTTTFHQAQPSQYNSKLLSHQYLVSFHKHYSDPMEIYEKYLVDQLKQQSSNEKTEL